MVMGSEDAGVILVLDANVLLSDPMCNAKVWRVLAHTPRAWNLRVLVPEVAFAETVGKHEASIASAMHELQDLSKRWKRLGFGDCDAMSAADGVRQRYEAHLRESLMAANVETLVSEQHSTYGHR